MSKRSKNSKIQSAEDVVAVSPAEATECLEKLIDLFGSAVTEYASAPNGDQAKHAALVRHTRAKLSEAVAILIKNQPMI